MTINLKKAFSTIKDTVKTVVNETKNVVKEIPKPAPLPKVNLPPPPPPVQIKPLPKPKALKMPSMFSGVLDKIKSFGTYVKYVIYFLVVAFIIGFIAKIKSIFS